MTQLKNLYITCIVMQDSNTSDLVGMARPVIANNEEEALSLTLAVLRESVPDIGDMEEKLREIKEIPKSFIEQAALEVLGWNKPVDN